MSEYPRLMKSLNALLIVACASVTLSLSIAAQTADKAAQFGSSLKQPKAEVSQKTGVPPSPKDAAG